MGHDISGYNPKNKETEIAYLRRSAFNELNGTIYEALNCNECNGGLSGNGSAKVFSGVELKKGLAYLGNNEKLEPEIKFLNDCINNLDEENQIYIEFF